MKAKINPSTSSSKLKLYVVTCLVVLMLPLLMWVNYNSFINNNNNNNKNPSSPSQSQAELQRKAEEEQKILVNKVTEKFKNDIDKMKEEQNRYELEFEEMKSKLTDQIDEMDGIIDGLNKEIKTLKTSLDQTKNHNQLQLQEIDEKLIELIAAKELNDDILLEKEIIQREKEDADAKTMIKENAAEKGKEIVVPVSKEIAEKNKKESQLQEKMKKSHTCCENDIVKRKTPNRNSTMLNIQYNCKNKTKIGQWEGGWYTCLDDLNSAKHQNFTVLSFGLGNDPSFDITFLKYFPESTVHAFDPTPTGENCFKRRLADGLVPKGWEFHLWGINYEDGNMTFYPPKGHDQYAIKDFDGQYRQDKPLIRSGYRLKTVMQKLNVDHVDVCKIDVEGSEWPLLDDLTEDLDIDQLFFEFHFFDFDKTDNFSEMVTTYLERLNEVGYYWFHKNNFRWLGKKYNPPAEHWYVEYSLIKVRDSEGELDI